MFLDHKDDITLYTKVFGTSQLSQVDSAGPVIWDGQPGAFLPGTLPQTLHRHHGHGLRSALEGAQHAQVASAFAAVVAHPVDINGKPSCRDQTHHDIKGLTW